MTKKRERKCLEKRVLAPRGTAKHARSVKKQLMRTQSTVHSVEHNPGTLSARNVALLFLRIQNSVRGVEVI